MDLSIFCTIFVRKLYILDDRLVMQISVFNFLHCKTVKIWLQKSYEVPYCLFFTCTSYISAFIWIVGTYYVRIRDQGVKGGNWVIVLKNESRYFQFIFFTNPPKKSHTWKLTSHVCLFLQPDETALFCFFPFCVRIWRLCLPFYVRAWIGFNWIDCVMRKLIGYTQSTRI